MKILKKLVPFLLRIETSHDPITTEKILLNRYLLVLEEQYSMPLHDFHSFAALSIRHGLTDTVPEIMKNGDEIKSEIRFQIINYKINNDENISEEDLVFHQNERRKIVSKRKKIIKKAIGTTNPGHKVLRTISPYNSQFYRNLLKLTSEFSDITLLDWFIPIVLPYERLIHIFVKHVEETKFAEGQFKRRTFFDYKPEEIWRLLKTIVKFDKQNIKDHFLLNSINLQLEQTNLMKDYWRGFKNPIIFNGDRFILHIDKNGFITQFYQLEKVRIETELV